MRISTLVVASIATVSLLSGCSSKIPVGYDHILDDLSPEVKTLAERQDDIDGHIAYTNNSNWRMFTSDFGRVFYTDHPSRLSPMPVTYTSGQPR